MRYIVRYITSVKNTPKNALIAFVIMAISFLSMSCHAAPLPGDLSSFEIAENVESDEASDPVWLPDLEQMQLPELEQSFPSSEVPWSDVQIDLRTLLLQPSQALEMLHPQRIWDWVVGIVWQGFYAQRGFLLQMIALGIFSGILRLFSDALQSQQLQSGLRWMLSLLFFSVLALRLREDIETTQHTVAQLSGVMLTMLPGITFYWTAAASLSNLALFKPAVIAAVQLATQFASTWIQPALMTSALLSLISMFTQPIDLRKIAKLLRNLAITALASTMMAIIALVNVQGRLSSAADGALFAGGKYLIKNTLPIVGGVAADALEMTAGTTLLLGQAVGWLGTLAVVAALVQPCLHLLLSALTLKIAAAVMAPFAESVFVDGIDTIGDAVLYFFALILLIGIFFYLMLTTLIGLQDISLLVRM